MANYVNLAKVIERITRYDNPYFPIRCMFHIFSEIHLDIRAFLVDIPTLNELFLTDYVHCSNFHFRVILARLVKQIIGVVFHRDARLVPLGRLRWTHDRRIAPVEKWTLNAPTRRSVNQRLTSKAVHIE